MLPYFWPVGGFRRAEFEALELIDVVGFMADILVARASLLRPML